MAFSHSEDLYVKHYVAHAEAKIISIIHLLFTNIWLIY